MPSSRGWVWCIALPAIFLTAAAHGRSSVPMGRVQDLVRGQKGQCRTVFAEHSVEPMNFEVQGVMTNYLGPGEDLLVIRLSDEKTQHSGVVAGMSGSPCYVDGKLVGALGYAFASFAKDPIAGVMPIQSMLEVWKQPRRDVWVAGAAPSDDRAGAVASMNDEFRPIATPLTMSGIPRDVMETEREWFESRGFQPMVGGGSSAATAGTTGRGASKGRGLEPGDPVAVVLVEGDVSVAGTGTVTHVDGEKILAFGHPFAGLGDVSLPMARARIIHTMASHLRSFKMSVTENIVGELTQDRLPAIAGELGRQPEMIPVKVKLKTPTGTEHYSFRVARDQTMTSRMFTMALAGVMRRNVEATRRGLLHMKAKIHMGESPPLQVEAVTSGDRDAGLMIRGAARLGRTMQLLWEAPFGIPPRMSVEVEAELSQEPDLKTIDQVRLSATRPDAGQTVQVKVRLEEQGKFRWKSFPIKIPPKWYERKVQLVVTNADGADFLKLLSTQPRPESREDIRRWFSRLHRPGRLYVLAVDSAIGFEQGVDLYGDVPGSAAARWGGGRAQSWGGMQIEEEWSFPMSGAVEGMDTVQLEVGPKR